MDALCLCNVMQTLERVWSNLKVLMSTLTCGSISRKLSNYPKHSLVFVDIMYILTTLEFPKHNHDFHLCKHRTAIFYFLYIICMYVLNMYVVICL